jgi:hypothetical protein
MVLLLVLFLAAAYFSWKKFWVLFSVNMFILVIYVVVGILGGYKPSFRALLLLLFPCGAFFVLFNIVAIVQFWEERGILTLLLLLVSISGFWLPGLAGNVGKGIRIKVFKSRLYLYEAAVKELTPMIGEKELDLRGDQIPQEYRKLAYSISAEKNEEIVFNFVWDPGFPMLGSSFIYRSDGGWPSGSFYERINDNWFIVGD